jgi:WD40 repeat protein
VRKRARASEKIRKTQHTLTYTLSHTPQGHTDYLHCIAAVPNSELVVTGSEDGQIGIWGEI